MIGWHDELGCGPLQRRFARRVLRRRTRPEASGTRACMRTYINTCIAAEHEFGAASEARRGELGQQARTSFGAACCFELMVRIVDTCWHCTLRYVWIGPPTPDLDARTDEAASSIGRGAARRHRLAATQGKYHGEVRGQGCRHFVMRDSYGQSSCQKFVVPISGAPKGHSNRTHSAAQTSGATAEWRSALIRYVASSSSTHSGIARVRTQK